MSLLSSRQRAVRHFEMSLVGIIIHSINSAVKCESDAKLRTKASGSSILRNMLTMT